MQGSVTTHIDTAALAQTLARKLAERLMSLREASEAMGVSASTISRIVNNRTLPDSETLARICHWIELDNSVFFAGGNLAVHSDGSDVMKIVEDLVSADQMIAPRNRSKLIVIFRACYEQMKHL